ncbi:MAG: adenylate/guanylate cyclase domain-containing protein [Candidatus Aminicenantes bacterium]|jgi:adenylate cyclase
MSIINIIGSDGRVSNFLIDKDEITIGRGEDNDLVLSDGSVSRHHAKIIKDQKNYTISDLGSFNGTRVNGKSIQSAPLKDEDEIRIGVVKLNFLSEKAAPSPLDSVVLTTDKEQEKGQQQVVETSAKEAPQEDSQELLIATDTDKSLLDSSLVFSQKEPKAKAEVPEEITSLERINKVLFVLYEISRQLHTIHDFNELLTKIMDNIFVVIDADYGYVILTGKKRKNDLSPVVVRYKDEKVKGKGELRASRTIIERVVKDKVAVLTSNAMTDSRFGQAQSLMMQQIRSAMCVPLWKKDKVIGVIQLDSVRTDNQFTEDDLELLKAIGCQMAMVIEQASLNEKIREEERMRNRLERFHSPQVIEMILKESEEEQENIMESKDITATILFTDIIGFTSLSEEMSPREINLMLNQFFSRMTDIIFKYDGMIDKYIGDCIMAVFGAPMEKKKDPERAIRAALEMRKELKKMMESEGLEKKFSVRIGINTGKVVAGNIGSPTRMEYTVIGDPVNIASRLESIAKPNQILIGDETYKRVKGKFKIKKVGPKKVKGKSAEIMVYEVL